MRRISWSPLCLMLWLIILPLLSVHTAHAQPPDDQLGESAAFLQLFPELRVLPAPVWFVPGARASYQASGAIIGGNSSGVGIVQYDPVASDGLQSLASVQSFTDNGAGELVPLGWNFKLGLPAVGEFWIHPLVLARAEQVANQNLAVVRLNKVYAGQTFTVVRFQSELANSTTVWEFDVVSGLLLFYRQSTTNLGTGTTQLTQLLFLNFRVMQLPWPAGRAPNWVRPGVVMDYNGQQTVTVPSAGPIPLPYAVRAILTPTARTWSIDTLTAFLNSINNGSVARVSGVGQIVGGMWIPREALGVNVGQTPVTLDTDPVTGAVITLQRDNGGAIVVRQIGNAHDTIMVYNPILGSLDRFIQTTSTPLSVTQTDVTRTGGDDLAALNALPELPTTFIPLVSP